jgi:CheY-like chemotaxis protein
LKQLEGPILIVDDDHDDQDIYAEAIKAIGIANEIRFFDEGQHLLDYLYNTAEKPYIILSDINMPQMNGLQLKEVIQRDDFLRAKGIPFVFISTNAGKETVRQAHALSVQGFFQKPTTMEDIKDMLQTLFNYWGLCKHVNNT